MIRTTYTLGVASSRWTSVFSVICALLVSLVTFHTARAADGFANVGMTVTGGAGGPTVTVTDLASLTAAIGDDAPRIVQVSGTINLGSSTVRFGSNKTIVGLGASSGFIGNLKCSGKTNVILQNLNFTNPNSVGDGDGLTIQLSTHIWVDHCSFVDCGDGSLDLTHAADFVTVSWCKFSYTFNSGHNFVNLVGHSDNNASEDRGKLRVTFHHNWWSTGCVERMPRVRFGQVHSYNNYFNAPGNNYCIRASIESQVLSEHNYFENVSTPHEYYSPNGRIRTGNNVYVNCTDVAEFSDTVFTPPYSYSPEPAANVKASVMAGAGTRSGTGPVPNAPSGLTASASSSSQINLAWTDNANNETGFTIERATGTGAFAVIATVGANVTSYQNTGLSPSTSYSYRVRAQNANGSSANSNTATATTLPGTGTPPAAPSSLTATAASSSQINLSWTDNSNNEAGFRIERSSGGSAFAEVGTVGANVTSFQNTGLAASTSYTYRVIATNSAGSSSPSNTASATTLGNGTGTTVTFVSIAAEDGRVLESSEGSNTGGSVDASGSSSSTLRTGDDSSDRQFKTFLSFDTSSIPDGATITSAVVRLRRGALSGSNPFNTHGSLVVDIKSGSGFSNSVTLQTGDFQAAADATQVATMSNPLNDGDVSTGTLNATGRSFINKTGKTQLRIYFTTDDNDDAGNDYIGWYSGNDATAANRPVLEVTYQ
jgi:pectate lyase